MESTHTDHASAPQGIVELSAQDRAAMVAHLEHLSDDDLALRFMTSGRPTPDQIGLAVDRMIALAGRGNAVNIGVRDPKQGGLVMLGIYGVEAGSDGTTAEIALSVLPQVRSQGLTRQLLQWSVTRALRDKVKWIALYFNPANERVRALVQKLGLQTITKQGESFARVDVERAGANIVSLIDRLQQLLDATHDIAAAKL